MMIIKNKQIQYQKLLNYFKKNLIHIKMKILIKKKIQYKYLNKNLNNYKLIKIN